MENENENENDRQLWAIASGVVIGFAVGGILGLLFAPKSGDELREDLRDKAEDALDNLQNATSDLAQRSRELLEQTRENVSHSIEAGKAAYTQKREELTARLEG